MEKNIASMQRVWRDAIVDGVGGEVLTEEARV